jgi:peptidoglycan-N-acetylglucosamine deacetylase
MIRIWTLIGLALAWAGLANAEIVTRLPTEEKVVALTFDACEAGKPMALDTRITAILAEKNVPYTIFMGGRFARDNAIAVAALARNPQIGIENHSWSHPADMRALGDAQVSAQITRAADEIARVSGRRTTMFRFPGGNADGRTIAIAEKLGYSIVHWRWAEGDPDPRVDAKALVSQTLSRTKPGDILIFHINGRGVHTAEALPNIIDGLRKKGFRFVLVSDYLRP